MWTPVELFDQLKAQTAAKHDYLVPTTKMAVAVHDAEPVLGVNVEGQDRVYRMRDQAHRQLQSWLKIPRVYYDRMLKEEPELLEINANRWLAREGGARRLVRTFDQTDGGNGFSGDVRAILSPRYKIMDHYDLLRTVLPAIQAADAQPWRAYLTDERMDIVFVSSKMHGVLDPRAHHIKDVAHEVIAALTISNSEVGLGGLRISVSSVLKACRNLYIALTNLFKIHLGRALQGEGDVTLLYAEDTRQYMQETAWRQLRDTVSATFNEENFTQMLAGFDRLRAIEVAQPVQVLKSVAEREGFDPDGLLAAFLHEPEPTAFGVTQAITRAAGMLAEAPESTNDREAVRHATAAGALVSLDDDEALRDYFSPDSDDTVGPTKDEDVN